MSKQRLIDADALKDALFQKHVHDGEELEPMLYLDDAMKVVDEAPTVDAITVSWIGDQIAQHTSETGWTDWWADMCRRFLQEYERRRDDDAVDRR